MAIYFPGRVGMKYVALTPQFRYDYGLAGGQVGAAIWINPDDVSFNQEILAASNYNPNYLNSSVVQFVVRLEAGGVLIVIHAMNVFGFCTVRRSLPGAVVAGQWQQITVVCLASNDMRVFIDGVEMSYAFSRSEVGLPLSGGGDVLFGTYYRDSGWPRGPDPAPHTMYSAYIRTITGDQTNADLAKRFTTEVGTWFQGGLACGGFWHAGLVQADADELAESLAGGTSPLFYPHFFRNSTFSHGLLMAPPLVGEDAMMDYDPIAPESPESPGDSPAFDIISPFAQKTVPVVGDPGVLSWMEGPGIIEPCEPYIDGPGPAVPTVPKLCLPFGLPRAEIYENPGNPADLLPIVYGSFRRGGLAAGPGPIPATLIDRGEDDLGPWVYCAAFHPVLSIDVVYVDNVAVVPSTDYGWNLSDNFQNRGTIATITFPTQPLGRVTWRGLGIYDRTGTTLMENCLDQVVHLLTTWGNFTLAEDFDLTALAEATSAVTRLGYKTAFVVFSEAVTQDWLTEMLFNVMGYWRVNGREQMEFHVDDGYSTLAASDLAAEVLAARDCLDGDDGVSFTLDRQNLVNDLTALYIYSYTVNEATSLLSGLTDRASIDAYGEMKKSVVLRGLRRIDNVRTWAAILLMRQSARRRVEGGLLAFTLLGGRFAHLTIGDLITLSWPYGPRLGEGVPYEGEVLRVANLTIDPSRGGAMAILAVDLGMRMIGGAAAIPDLPALPSDPSPEETPEPTFPNISPIGSPPPGPAPSPPPSPPPPSPPGPTAPPAPLITGFPGNPTARTSATFTFTDGEAGVSYVAQLDGGGFVPVTSPVTYDGLSVGSHSFGVKAQNASGLLSPATTFAWTIDTLVHDAPTRFAWSTVPPYQFKTTEVAMGVRLRALDAADAVATDYTGSAVLTLALDGPGDPAEYSVVKVYVSNPLSSSMTLFGTNTTPPFVNGICSGIFLVLAGPDDVQAHLVATDGAVVGSSNTFGISQIAPPPPPTPGPGVDPSPEGAPPYDLVLSTTNEALDSGTFICYLPGTTISIHLFIAAQSGTTRHDIGRHIQINGGQDGDAIIVAAPAGNNIVTVTVIVPFTAVTSPTFTHRYPAGTWTVV